MVSREGSIFGGGGRLQPSFAGCEESGVSIATTGSGVVSMISSCVSMVMDSSSARQSLRKSLPSCDEGRGGGEGEVRCRLECGSLYPFENGRGPDVAMVMTFDCCSVKVYVKQNL